MGENMPDKQIELLEAIKSHLSDISANVLEMSERLERIESSVETLVQKQDAK
jgi:hypothetical protein